MSQDSLDALDLRLRTALLHDPRIGHALAYGSRTVWLDGRPLADEHSDLEYYAYTLPGADLDPRAWLEAQTALLLYTVNPFGTPNGVTPELHRIELHVVPQERLDDVPEWFWWYQDPARMLVKDGDGRLARALERFAAHPFTLPPPQDTLDNTLNWLTFGTAVLARGERLRAAELLFWVRDGLLRLLRQAEGAAQPPAAARLAEGQLSAAALTRLAPTVCRLEELEAAYRAGLELAAELAAGLELNARPELVAGLQGRLAAAVDGG